MVRGAQLPQSWFTNSIRRRLVPAVVAATLVGVGGGLGCTGPRPVLIDPIAEPTLDAAAYAAGLPDSSRQVLEPADPSRPGEPTAEDAIWVWSQRAGLDYQGPCDSAPARETSDAVCSVRVEDYDVYRIGPDSDETWWVIGVDGADASYRVQAVYLAGQG